jgi:hypothetical protein
MLSRALFALGLLTFIAFPPFTRPALAQHTSPSTNIIAYEPVIEPSFDEHKIYKDGLSAEQQNRLTDLEMAVENEIAIDQAILEREVLKDACNNNGHFNEAEARNIEKAFINWLDERKRFQDLERSKNLTMASKLEFFNSGQFQDYRKIRNDKFLEEAAQLKQARKSDNNFANAAQCTALKQELTPYIPPNESLQSNYIETHEQADKTQNYELLTAKLYFKLCLQYYLEPQKLKSELTELGFSPVREDKAALFAHALKLRNTEADYYITPWQDGIFMAGFAKDGSSCHFGRNFKLDFPALYENVMETAKDYESQNLFTFQETSTFRPALSFDASAIATPAPHLSQDHKLIIFYGVNPYHNTPNGQIGTVMIMGKI